MLVNGFVALVCRGKCSKYNYSVQTLFIIYANMSGQVWKEEVLGGCVENIIWNMHTDVRV